MVLNLKIIFNVFKLKRVRILSFLYLFTVLLFVYVKIFSSVLFSEDGDKHLSYFINQFVILKSKFSFY